ncbi:MAG TPA: hypothetical protein DEB40_13555 [Elusimicrobia bacterium]|nr:hypothetical protein [Elusimicrobiota bacterium]HBT62760.1 hypothetical protein [Elusimicrobiota bacterium]
MRLLHFLLALAAAAAPPADGGRGVVGGVVRSREWVIRRAPRKEEEFIGDVSYRKGPSFMSADWALLRHEPQIWQARGHVRLVHTLRSGDVIDVSGDRAEFDQKTGRGHLLGLSGGPISYRRAPADVPPDSGTALRLDWEGSRRARLSGEVHVWGPRLELWAAQADYDADQDALTLSGDRPTLRLIEGDWTGAVQADVVVARQKPDVLLADGKTRGWIRFKERLEKLAQ